MTREEAIKILKAIRVYECYPKSASEETKEAIDMAIETLSAKSEQTIRHIENNAKESDLVYRPSADDTFCKSQLITCNRAKECNGVCPFEDALKHADKMQTMNDQHTVGHDREWIIGCIEHDGFIHTHRFDKANQIIHDALSAEAVEVVRCGRCEWWKCNPNTTEYGVCKKVSYDDFEVIMDSDDFCSYGERREDGEA